LFFFNKTGLFWGGGLCGLEPKGTEPAGRWQVIGSLMPAPGAWRPAGRRWLDAVDALFGELGGQEMSEGAAERGWPTC
jgi:hypothetical protein